jgi:DNA-3-methyladenine glycosylase II
LKWRQWDDGGAAASAKETPIAPMNRSFDTEPDSREIKKYFSTDPWLASLFVAAPVLRVLGAWSALELIVRTIVGQSVSVKARQL